MERFFVSRPIFAICIALAIVLLGAISIFDLSIEQYPDITPPVVEVTASYSGADAETVNDAVATPVAQSVMGVSDMLYMQSTSANDGSMVLQVVFDVGTDPDLDAIFTQNNVATSTALLPSSVVTQGVVTQKTMTGFLMVFALHSDGRYDNEFLSNYAYINLQNQLLKINGVGKVSIMGAGEYAMRIWVKPDLLNYYNVSLDELRAAVLAEGGIYPAGQFGAEPSPEGTTYTYTVTMPRQISTAEEFAAIVVKTRRRADLSARRGRRGAGQQVLRRRFGLRRRAGHAAGHLSGAGQQCRGRRQPREGGHRAVVGTVSRRRELYDDRRFDREHPLGRGGDHPHADSGARAGDRHYLPFHSGLAGDAHSARRHSGLAHRHVHLLPAVGLLDQHHLAVRAGIGDRTGGRRCDRGGRSRAGQHRTRHEIPRGGDRGDAQRRFADRSHDRRAAGRLHPDVVRGRNFGAAVPAVRRDDLGLGRALGLQRSNAVARAVRLAAQTPQGGGEGFLRRIQPAVRPLAGRLFLADRRHRAPHGAYRRAVAGDRLCDRCGMVLHARRIPSRRGPGLRDGRGECPRSIVAAGDAGGAGRGRPHHPLAARSAVYLLCRWVQHVGRHRRNRQRRGLRQAGRLLRPQTLGHADRRGAQRDALRGAARGRGLRLHPAVDSGSGRHVGPVGRYAGFGRARYGLPGRADGALPRFAAPPAGNRYGHHVVQRRRPAAKAGDRQSLRHAGRGGAERRLFGHNDLFGWCLHQQFQPFRKVVPDLSVGRTRLSDGPHVARQLFREERP